MLKVPLSIANDCSFIHLFVKYTRRLPEHERNIACGGLESYYGNPNLFLVAEVLLGSGVLIFTCHLLSFIKFSPMDCSVLGGASTAK